MISRLSPPAASRRQCVMTQLSAIAAILVSAQAAMAQDLGPAATDPAVPKDPETILRVQVFLDRKFFGPGKIDGALGEFTYKAVVNYNFAHGNDNLYDWQSVIESAEQAVPTVYAACKIKEELVQYVNPDLPVKPEEQEAYPYMAYRSLGELVAERYHTDETFLAKANPGVNVEALKPGDIVRVPNVAPFFIENVAKYKGYKNDAVLSTNTIVVDTTERMAAVYNASEVMLAAFPITPGKPEFIPIGTWKVSTMMTTPNFRYDKKFLEEGTRGDTAFQIPPGPNSPVGIIWCGLSKSGIGLHGTASPRTIGRSRSAGCVRFANWDAIRLPDLVRPGSTVIVR
ncbi:MAG: L,D-transpeptidase [Verrucomicrobiaceae bacterium]|nr:L,D-transpeptidase [Verrucomicrobiaceae bacterium]